MVVQLSFSSFNSSYNAVISDWQDVLRVGKNW